MTEAELRALVRDVINRHLSERAPEPAAHPTTVAAVRHPARAHASHGQFTFPTPEACVIEPSVPCEHCGYCKSYGH